MRTYINKCLYYKESKTPGVAGRTDRDSTRGVFHGRPYIESLEKKGKGNASAPPVPPYRGTCPQTRGTRSRVRSRSSTLISP